MSRNRNSLLALTFVWLPSCTVVPRHQNEAPPGSEVPGVGHADVEGLLRHCPPGQYPLLVLDLWKLRQTSAGRVTVAADGRLQGRAAVSVPCTAFLVLDQLRVVPLFLRPGKTTSFRGDVERLADGMVFPVDDKANTLAQEFASLLDIMAFPLKSETPAFIDAVNRLSGTARSKVAAAHTAGQLSEVEAHYLRRGIASRVEYAFETHARFKRDDASAAALLEYARTLLPIDSHYLTADGGWQRPLELLHDGPTGESQHEEWFRFVSASAADDAARHYMLGRSAIRRLEGLDDEGRAAVVQALNNTASSALMDIVREHADRTRGLQPGRPAPAVKAIDERGKAFTATALHGRLVVIEFWASWCPHCKVEAAAWENLVESYRGDDRVAFVSLNVDDEQQRWRDALKERGLASANEHRLWAGGGFESAPYTAFGVSGVPHYFLVDADGRFLDLEAARPTSGLGAAIAELLAKR